LKPHAGGVARARRDVTRAQGRDRDRARQREGGTRNAPSDNRWPRLDRSIIQGFALDDVDGLPGCSSVVVKASGALMRVNVEVIIPPASLFDRSRSAGAPRSRQI